MSKTGAPRNRYRKGEVKAQMRDALGSDKLEYELDDGSVVSFPWPFDLDAAQREAFKGFDEDTDTEELVKVLLGADQYARFEADDGDPFEIGLIWADAGQMITDYREGRKRPTRS